MSGLVVILGIVALVVVAVLVWVAGPDNRLVAMQTGSRRPSARSTFSSSGGMT